MSRRPDPRPADRPPTIRAAVPVLAVAAALALPAALGAAPAAAKSRPAPCPTSGTTLLRSSQFATPRYRVYRVGSALRICTRTNGRRRRIKQLGPWTAATRVTGTATTVAWTTRSTVQGVPADAIRVLDVPSRRRVLTITKAAASPAAGTPAAPDVVVGLRTDELVTAWVTGGGRLAAAVRLPGSVPPPDPAPGPYHDGRVYVLRDVGPAQAAALAKGLVLIDDSQTDDCGGTLSRRLSIPAVQGAPAGGFQYFEQEAEPGPGCN